MSMEALLDEENREVLAAIDRQRPSSPLPKFRPPRTATPPPVRSMLDVDSPTPRHGSIAGIGVGVTSPTTHRHSGKELDPTDPSSWTSPHSSKPNSPVLTKASPVLTRPRNSSESDRPAGLPKVETDEKRGFEQNYQFDIASIPSTAPASRSPPVTTRPREGSGSAMAAALSGDLASLRVSSPGAGRGKSSSLSTTTTHSRSPSSRNRKPDVPKSALLSPTSPSVPLTTNSGTVVDDQAHLRLTQTKSGSFSTATDDSEDPGRITKDDIGAGDDEVVDSDDVESSDEDEARGRPEKRKLSANGHTADVKSPGSSATSSPEEVKRIPHSQQFVKSLLEPSISITSPTGEKITGSKEGTSTPRRLSVATADDDEDEEAAAIRKAKSLAMNLSELDTTVVDRHVQIILRGNWAQFHHEADSGQRSARLYLLCSDLSVEASYAMEWVVGTMMRDGDTLLAIYAMEDENAGKTSEAEKEVLTAEGNKAGKDASDVMDTLTRQTTQGGGTILGLGKGLKYTPATEVESLTGSVDARKVSKKEMERLKAVEALTTDFQKLVRKTTLQVRCMIEVIHCKSPKHLILGAVCSPLPCMRL